MNISMIKRRSTYGCMMLVLLSALTPLQAAGWLDTLSTSRIGQWFGSQSTATRLGIAAVTTLGVAAACCYGYRYFAPSAIPNQGIDLFNVDMNNSGEYEIYRFGDRQDVLENDINVLTDIFGREGSELCSKEDKDYMISLGAFGNITRACVQELAKSGVLSVDCGFLGVQPWFDNVDTYIMRSNENRFIGFILSGRVAIDGKVKTGQMLFVAPEFRRCGYAKKLLAFGANQLKNEQGEVAPYFYAQRANPACYLYDRLEGFERSVIENGRCYKYTYIGSLNK